MSSCRAIAAILTLALAGALLGAVTGAATDAVEAARARLAAAETPGERAVALGDLSAAYAAVMETLRASLRAMPGREAALRERLGPANGAALASIGALHRALSSPPSAALAHPDGPRAAARARLALAGLAEHAVARERELSRALGALARLAAERRETLGLLEEASAGLASARRTIAAGLTGGTAMAGDPVPVDLAALSARLGSLALGEEDAMAQRAALMAARGDLPLPTRGPALPDGFGLSLRAPPWAVPRSPTLATVRHAGPVRPLGEVVVLEPAPGALIVIQGLADLRVATGATVEAGQPIGLFDMDETAIDDNVNDIGARDAGETRRRIYIEFWLDGRREDAADWFDLDPDQPARLQ